MKHLVPRRTHPSIEVRDDIVYYVPYRVITAMNDAVDASPHTEDGQAMFGIHLDDGSWIVLGTIPDVVGALRQEGALEIGGQDQVELFKWFNAHWTAMRERSRGPAQPHWKPGDVIPKGVLPVELDKPLEYMGEWHKHPGGYNVLSGTDLGQIEGILSDRDVPKKQFLTPLATMTPESVRFHLEGRQLVIEEGTEKRIRFFYHEQDEPDKMWEIAPVPVSDEQVPWIPGYPWHLLDPRRFESELRALRRNGRRASWFVRQMDGDTELEIVFAIDHQDWTHRMVIVTDWDFPNRLPKILLYPKREEEKKQAEQKDAAATAQAKPAKKEEPKGLLSWLKKVFGPIEPVSYDQYAPAGPMRWNYRGYLVDEVNRVAPQIRKPVPPPQPVVVAQAQAPVEKKEGDKKEGDKEKDDD